MIKLTKKIIAMLLSGILVLGSATSSVLAASIDLDPNQTSEIAEEVYDKDTSEAPAGAGESYPEEASANEEAVEYYTVTLDANGGYFEHEWDDVLEETVENTEVLNKTIPFGGIVEIVPVKDSATFLGWRLELDGEVLGAEYAPKENCTLYAAWQMEGGVIEGETTGVVPAVDEVPAEEGDPVEDVIEEELPAEETDGQETIDEGDVQEEEFVDDFEQFDAEQDTEVAAESETDELDPTQDAETAEVEETDAQYNAEGTAQVTSEAQEPEPENAEVGESAATSQIMDTKAKEQDATPEQDETAMIDAGEEYVSTDAAMEVVASGWCGDNLNWTLDDAGTLTISGTGEMWDYDYDDNHVYYGETSAFRYLSFEKVILENGVTSIGKAAFACCYSLKSLTIPDSVTSIGEEAFRKCKSLPSVTIPNSVTSIEYLAFHDCHSLLEITVGLGNPEYSSIDGVLFNKNHTILFTYPGGKGGKYVIPDSVEIIGQGAFFNCSSLESVTIPGGVRNIWVDTFAGCSSLMSVTIPDSVTSIGAEAFCGCSSLPSVTIPDSVESIGRCAFEECSGLTNVTFGNSVTSIEDYAFYGCSSLPSVTIPDNVLFFGKDVFRDCTSLRNVIIPVWWPSDRYGAFLNTPWLEGGCLVIKNNILVRCLGGGDIIIPDGVTCIGESAFYDNEGLQSVTIPDSVTSIGNYAFGHCFSLMRVTIPVSVISIKHAAFINCEKLTDVYYAGSKQEWDDISIEEGNDYLTDAAIYYDKNPVIESGPCGDHLTWMLDDAGTLTIHGTGEMWDFYYVYGNDGDEVSDDSHPCIFKNYEIKTVKITKGVTSIGKYAFYGCIYLQNVTISKNVTSIGDYAFDYCSSLTSVTIPNSVTSIGKSVFCDCSRLTSVTIPNSVTSIGESAFIRCRRLTSVTIPDSVTSIGCYAFCYCSSLESVTISGSVGSIDESVFKDCTSLTSVTIPESVTSIGRYAFYDCSSLMSVTIPDSVTSIGAEAFKYCSALKTVTIPNSVTSIGAETFQNCGLTSVIIPDSVMEIGFNAFENCISLTSVTIPDSVTSIKSGTFQNCISLTSVTVPNSVWVIGDHAFCACSSLESVTIPDSVTNIKDWAFCNCTSLASVTIPDSVTSIGGSVFSNCRSLESVTIPDSVTSIGMCVFNECYKLKSVNIPDSVMDIGGYAFMYCTSLTSVTIPNSVTSIEAGTFQYCRSLESVTISDSVTSIGNSAFLGCISLMSVSIPDSVTSIGESAFRDCSSLTSVSIPDGVTSIGEGAFSDCPDALVIYGTIGSYAEQYAKNNNITFKVNSKQISGVIVTGLPTMTYNGRAQTPAPVVKIGSTTLKANTDYTVSYKNNTYAGTATVTITGIGNYEGTVTATFTIKKAAQTMTAKAAASSIAVGKTTTVSITGAKGTKSFKSSDISIATVDKSTGKLTAKKVGTVKITATSAATSNFNAASKTVTVKVVPAATASLTAANQATGIKLTWKKVTGATGYLVYRGSTKIATIKSGSTVTYTDTKANTNGGKYTYKIIATVSTGNGPAKSVTTYCVARPAISSVTNSASKRMTVKWGKNAKASGYQIHYCMDKTFKTGNKSVSVTSAATVSKAIASLTKGKTYYVRIRTYKTVGSTKYFSAWSPVKSVKISK